MQSLFPFHRSPAAAPNDSFLQVGAQQLPLRFVRHRRARRYVLRLGRDGAARVTVPRGGTMAEAWRFAQRNIPWLEQQQLKRALQPAKPRLWTAGTEVLFRGAPARLELASTGTHSQVRLADQLVRVANPEGDLRPPIERHLWRLARRELPPRVFELAAGHQFRVARVTVRNQRSRWGSCSRRGTVSLNWRLIQAPPAVRDYLILHELAHFREMNHSHRFWQEVARLCPEWKAAELWLKAHADLLSA